MFGFRTSRAATAAEPLLNQKTAAAWLRQLPGADLVGRHQQVVRAIEDMCQAGRSLDFDRIGAIEFLDSELGADRSRLIAQYVEHASGNALVAERIWQSAYAVSHAFTAAYRALVTAATERAAESRWRRALPRLLARLIHFHGVDAKLRALKSVRWIPAKWMELHALYRQAADLAVARNPLPPSSAGQGATALTIEQEYIAVLLTHLLNTGTLAPGEVDWAAAQLRVWISGLELDAVARSTCGFVVDVGGRSGLVRRSRDERGTALRYLDIRPLAQQLERGIALQRRQASADGEAGGQINVQRLAILERLRPAFSPEAPSAVQRDPRTPVSLAAQVRTGLARICQELAPSEARNAAIETVRGAVNNPDDAADAAPGDAGPDSWTKPPPGEWLWQLEDRSTTGLRVVAHAGLGEGLGLGTLVAIRPPGEREWILGVVRRMTKATSEKVDAGVAVLASRFLAVSLHAKHQARDDMGFVVDGVDVSTVGKRFDGLYLAPQSRPDKPLSAKSLIVPAAEYGEGHPLILITARSVYTVALREVVERQADWIWATIEIVAKASRS